MQLQLWAQINGQGDYHLLEESDAFACGLAASEQSLYVRFPAVGSSMCTECTRANYRRQASPSATYLSTKALVHPSPKPVETKQKTPKKALPPAPILKPHPNLIPERSVELIRVGVALSAVIEADPDTSFQAALLSLPLSLRTVIYTAIHKGEWSLTYLSKSAQRIVVAEAQKNNVRSTNAGAVAKPPPLITCETCGVSVRSDHLLRHMNKHATMLPSKPEKQKSRTKPQKPSLSLPPLPSLVSLKRSSPLHKEADIPDLLKRLFQEQAKKAHQLEMQMKAEGKAQVVPGCVVTVRDMDSQEDIRYYLYGNEADRNAGMLVDADFASCESPIGRTLNEKFEGDTVNVYISTGIQYYQVVKVEALPAKATKNGPVLKKDGQSSLAEKKARSSQDREGNTVSMDGSHNIGYMARDNGQWGSFPLHDDYGDEADAEGVEREF